LVALLVAAGVLFVIVALNSVSYGLRWRKMSDEDVRMEYYRENGIPLPKDFFEED